MTPEQINLSEMAVHEGKKPFTYYLFCQFCETRLYESTWILGSWRKNLINAVFEVIILCKWRAEIRLGQNWRPNRSIFLQNGRLKMFKYVWKKESFKCQKSFLMHRAWVTRQTRRLLKKKFWTFKKGTFQLHYLYAPPPPPPEKLDCSYPDVDRIFRILRSMILLSII